jgi:hypothetical protein
MVNSTKPDFGELFREKNLYRIFRNSPSSLGTRFNRRVVWTTAVMLFAFSALHAFIPLIRNKYPFPFADTFALWANAGLGLASTILGFLIAGFAVVCTILRPRTVLALQRLRNKEHGMSELKLMFVIFGNVFVQYLALLFWSIVVLVFGGKNGPAEGMGLILSKIHWMVPFCLLHLLFVLWGTWLIALVLALKSFVYNLYQSLAMALAD